MKDIIESFKNDICENSIQKDFIDKFEMYYNKSLKNNNN